MDGQADGTIYNANPYTGVRCISVVSAPPSCAELYALSSLLDGGCSSLSSIYRRIRPNICLQASYWVDGSCVRQGSGGTALFTQCPSLPWIGGLRT